MEFGLDGAAAFEWMGLTWADRWLNELGATSRTQEMVHQLAAASDLRTVNLPAEAVRAGLADVILLHALLVRGDCVGLAPFEDGVPLGPLAVASVYSGHSAGQRAGRVHGPGCQHHRELRGDDNLLTLGEWLKQMPAAAGDTHASDDVAACDRCGGFAMRRLNKGELRFWRSAHQVYAAKQTLDEFEGYVSGAPRSGGRSLNRYGGERVRQTLKDVGAVLGRHEGESALDGYVKDVQARSEDLTRAARLWL